MPKQTILDAVANDLAVWLDQTSTRIAAAMAPQGQAPFAAQLSEQQKLEYYRDQLFNPDGTPNTNGRQAQIARLGPQGFTQVYRAVINAYPQLRVPSPPEVPPGPTITAMAQGGIVTQPTLALIGEAGPEAVVPLSPQESLRRVGQGATGEVPGLLQPGNIDLNNRPVVRNTDGSYSTVRSISFSDDNGHEVLIPTVSDDGRIMSNREAIDQYYNTGRHLGIFVNPDTATAYALQLHQQQEQRYGGNR